MQVTIERIRENLKEYKVCSECLLINKCDNTECHTCKSKKFESSTLSVKLSIDDYINFFIYEEGLSYKQSLQKKVRV